MFWLDKVRNEQSSCHPSSWNSVLRPPYGGLDSYESSQLIEILVVIDAAGADELKSLMNLVDGIDIGRWVFLGKELLSIEILLPVQIGQCSIHLGTC